MSNKKPQPPKTAADGFRIPIYGIPVYIFVGKVPKEEIIRVAGWKRYLGADGPHMHLEGVEGVSIHLPNMGGKVTFSYIVHEICHAVNAILHMANVVCEFKMDEPQAYLMGYLADEICTRIAAMGYGIGAAAYDDIIVDYKDPDTP